MKRLSQKCADVNKAKARYQTLIKERDAMIIAERAKTPPTPWNELIEATGLGRHGLLRIQRKANT